MTSLISVWHGFISHNPILGLLSETWHYGRFRRKTILLCLVSFITAQSIMLCQPLALGGMLDRLQKGTLDFHGVLLFMGLHFLCEVGFWTFHYPARVLEEKNGFTLRAQFRKELFQVLTELPMSWHRDRVSGDTIDKVNRGAQALYSFSAFLFVPVYTLVRLTGAFVALFLFMPMAAVVAILMCCIAIGIIMVTDKVYIQMRRKINEAESRVTGRLFDFLANITTIITLRLESQAQSQLDRTLLVALPTVVRNATLNEIKWCATNASVALMIVSVMILKARHDLASGMPLSVGSFYLMFEYLRRVGMCFFEFAWKWGEFVNQWTDVRGVAEIRKDHQRLTKRGHVDMPPSSWLTIEVRDLSFQYEDEERHIHHINQVSFSLERGKRYALVGESGSGKSTLLKLMRGVLIPDAGSLLIDDKHYTLGTLFRMTTLIPQEPEIFADSIASNVSFWLGASEGEVLRALDLARFTNVLERLPKGLATNIAEKGVNLSGGEKQRLAVGRGIFFAKESPVILLDEPTSSVDARNERLIYQAIFAEFPDAIIASALHKLHLLDLFDEILFFEDGNLIAKGDLPSLLRAGGRFAALYREVVETGND